MAMLATGTLLLSVLLGLGYHLILPRPKTAWRALWKVLPILTLSLFVAIVGGHLLLILALLLAAAGDAFLAFDGDRALLRGMAAFLLSHLSYIALILLTTEAEPLLAISLWKGTLTALIAVATVIVLFNIRPTAGRLMGPIVVYALVLATLLALAAPSGPLIFVGACLFIASDLILVTRRYWSGPDHPYDRVAARAVWTSYFLAQLLLTLGLVTD